MHKSQFHRGGPPTLLSDEEAARRLEAMRSRQANSKQRRLVRTLRAAEMGDGQPASTVSAVSVAAEGEVPLSVDMGWPQEFLGLLDRRVLKEEETQTSTVHVADNETSTEVVVSNVGVQSYDHREIPGFPTCLTMDTVVQHLRENPTHSAHQAVTELLPWSESFETGRREFRQLLAAFMFVQRETVREMRRLAVDAAKADPEDRPAMVEALNAITNELADRNI